MLKSLLAFYTLVLYEILFSFETFVAKLARKCAKCMATMSMAYFIRDSSERDISSVV